jgi:hypothetical protein
MVPNSPAVLELHMPCRPAAWGEAGVLDSRYTPLNYVRMVLHVQVEYQYALPARCLAFSIIAPPVPVPGVVCSKGLGCSWRCPDINTAR